jgi:hypothetical protein
MHTVEQGRQRLDLGLQPRVRYFQYTLRLGVGAAKLQPLISAGM